MSTIFPVTTHRDCAALAAHDCGHAGPDLLAMWTCAGVPDLQDPEGLEEPVESRVACGHGQVGDLDVGRHGRRGQGEGRERGGGVRHG